MNKQYLHDFFESLKNQANQNFDVIVVNGGNKDFEKIKKLYNKKLNIIELQYSGTPEKNIFFPHYILKNYLKLF